MENYLYIISFISISKLVMSETVSVTYNNGYFQAMPGINYFESVVAWANLTNDQQNNGWIYLEITTNKDYPDEIQARAAGFAEGYLTKESIHNYYREFYSRLICNDEASHGIGKDFCKFLKKQLRTNTEFVGKSIARKSKSEPYWHMVNLVFLQMNGIMEGFLAKTDESNEIIDNDDFDTEYGILLINYIADIWDYIGPFEDSIKIKSKDRARPSCSVLIKHLQNKGEMYIGHNTWHEYSAMGYRYLKKYNLNVHTLGENGELVPGHSMSMSSYPATIVSLDDFLTISSGLITTETTLNIYNQSLYNMNDASSQLFEPVRIMVANRLSTNGKEWTETVSRYNSGTYNNQWMVVDYNKVMDDGSLEDGALWIYEQLPGRTFSGDQTNILRKQGYWKSYNRAYYPEIHKLSGGQEMEEKHGNYFSYNNTPRAKIMAREQEKVIDEASMIQFMRYNDFQNDPEANVEGCNNPIPAGSIANRCDLTLPESKCEWEEMDQMVGHKGYGALDMKFVSKNLFNKDQNFWAVAGPMHNEKVPPFSWSNTNITGRPFYTPIITFDFQPSVHTWWLKPIHEAIY